MSQTSHEFVIAGGGLVGLGIGWRLALAGADVAIVERDRLGQRASRVAGGMLAAGLEADDEDADVLRFGQASQVLWPGFRDELEAQSGIEIGYRSEGSLQVSSGPEDDDRIRERFERLARMGVKVEWLDGKDLHYLEPDLAPECGCGFLSPADHQVDPRAVVEALSLAFKRAGGIVYEGQTIHDLKWRDGQAVGLVTDEYEIGAGQIIVAMGAWSTDLLSQDGKVLAPTVPVKGQILTVMTDPSDPLLDHVVWGDGIYLIPRRDGRLLIGATVEREGFDETSTVDGVRSLIEGARALLPEIGRARLIEMSAGLRPGTRDLRPILGPVEARGLVIATGHYRNGVLHTPVTAKVVSEYLMSDTWPAEFDLFSVARLRPSAQPGPAPIRQLG